MKQLLIILSLVLLLSPGCAWFQTEDNMNAYELAIKGMEEFNSQRYNGAIESFEKLRDWYPFSKYAILAELKVADAHYQLQHYEDAVYAYEEFENLHPRNEAIPYVIYQIGLCQFEQIDTIDRDQTNAKAALHTFKRLLRQFPDDSYANLARANIKKCLKSLAGNEFYIGLYYYKTKHYKGALSRFKAVLKNYPDAGVHYQALQYIALSEEKLKKEKSE